jgi:hypothetical protein
MEVYLQSTYNRAKESKMKSKIAIYLAGSIKKGHESGNDLFWTEDHKESLKGFLHGFEVSFLNPAFRTDDLSDQRSVFGRDMVQVFCSDCVFVDARDRRGLGVGAEMMWAKLHQIPVVTWAPRDTHYHKSQTTILDVPVENFIHPFVLGLSDQVVETLEEGAQWIRQQKSHSKIKGFEDIRSAMHYYKTEQLERDLPMKELLAANEKLLAKLAQ